MLSVFRTLQERKKKRKKTQQYTPKITEHCIMRIKSFSYLNYSSNFSFGQDINRLCVLFIFHPPKKSKHQITKSLPLMEIPIPVFLKVLILFNYSKNIPQRCYKIISHCMKFIYSIYLCHPLISFTVLFFFHFFFFITLTHCLPFSRCTITLNTSWLANTDFLHFFFVSNTIKLARIMFSGCQKCIYIYLYYKIVP